MVSTSQDFFIGIFELSVKITFFFLKEKSLLTVINYSCKLTSVFFFFLTASLHQSRGKAFNDNIQSKLTFQASSQFSFDSNYVE